MSMEVPGDKINLLLLLEKCFGRYSAHDSPRSGIIPKILKDLATNSEQKNVRPSLKNRGDSFWLDKSTI